MKFSHNDLIDAYPELVPLQKKIEELLSDFMEEVDAINDQHPIVYDVSINFSERKIKIGYDMDWSK